MRVSSLNVYCLQLLVRYESRFLFSFFSFDQKQLNNRLYAARLTIFAILAEVIEDGAPARRAIPPYTHARTTLSALVLARDSAVSAND